MKHKNYNNSSFQKGLRLTDEEIEAIKEVAKEVFGQNVKLWIFGSRTKLDLKGGDIDIYIEVPNYISYDFIKKKVIYLVKLEDKIGEQKIDVIIAPYNCEKFYCIEAKKTGVRLL